MARLPLADVARLRDGLRRFASGFTPGQKAVTIAAVVAAVVGGIAVMSFTGKPTYSPLFTNLQPSDASSITSKLNTDKVPYKLAAGGTTIMVPANDVDQERLALAKAGLPASSTVGLSVLDKEGITASNMTQQADYLRALQGELEQTIDSLNGVASSQVDIALPANQDFALNNDNPTGASVMVTMKPGQALSDANVQAIVHLVGSSVPHLDASQVTVADSNGDLLAGPGVPEGAGGSNSQTDAYDQAVQHKVQQYLDAVLGPNNADVQVNGTLDYDQVSTSTQSILTGPKGQAQSFCTQTTSSNETYTGSGVPAGGAAGTIAVPAGGTSAGNFKQTQTSQTCETSQQTKTVQQAPGTVKTQSVAVLVNSRALPPSVSLAALHQGVAAAAGIDTSRGDTLAFSAMPFNTAAAKQAAKSAAAAAAHSQHQALVSLIRTAVVLLLVALALLALWRSARKARLAPTGALLSPADLAALQATVPLEEPAADRPAMALPQAAAVAPVPEMARFIDSQPEEVAQVLRGWLSDKRELTAP